MGIPAEPRPGHTDGYQDTLTDTFGWIRVALIRVEYSTTPCLRLITVCYQTEFHRKKKPASNTSQHKGLILSAAEVKSPGSYLRKHGNYKISGLTSVQRDSFCSPKQFEKHIGKLSQQKIGNEYTQKRLKRPECSAMQLQCNFLFPGGQKVLLKENEMERRPRP